MNETILQLKQARVVFTALLVLGVACGGGDEPSEIDAARADDDLVIYDLSDDDDAPTDMSDTEDSADDPPADSLVDDAVDRPDEDAAAADTPVDSVDADATDLSPELDLADDAADSEDVDSQIGNGEIGITVLDRSGAPLWGAHAVRHRADGSVSGLIIVAADEHPGGRVVIDIAAGDGVTVAHQRDDGLALYTVVDLMPGDELTIQDPRQPIDVIRRDATQFVDLPDPEIDGTPFEATSYVVGNGCRTLQLSELPTEAVRLDFPSACVGAAAALDIVAWGLDELQVPVAFAVLLGHPFPSGEAAVLSAWNDAADLSGLTVTLNNSPTDIRPSLRLTVSKVGQTYATWPSYRPTDGSTVIGVGEGQSFIWGVVPGFADTYEHEITLDFGTVDSPLLGQVAYRRRDAELLSTLPIDLTADLLSRVEAVAVTDTSDATRPNVQWVLAGPTPAADMIEMRVQWTQNGPAPANREWTIVAPPDLPESYRLPSLAADLASFRPDNQILSGHVSVAYWDADFVENYRGFVNQLGLGHREHALRDLGQYTIIESRVTND